MEQRECPFPNIDMDAEGAHAHVGLRGMGHPGPHLGRSRGRDYSPCRLSTGRHSSSWQRRPWLRPVLSSPLAPAQGTTRQRLVEVSASDPASWSQRAFPGRNGRIAFQAYVNDVSEVFTIKANGDARERLTHNVVVDSDPTWSRSGRRGRPARMPLPESIVLALEAAAQDRATGALLLGQTGRPIHRSTLDNIVHHMGVEAGISRRVTSLLLPASCLTNALDSGASLAKVQHLARHAQPQTTMRYDRNRTNLYDHAIHSLVSYLTPRDEDEDRMET